MNDTADDTVDYGAFFPLEVTSLFEVFLAGGASVEVSVTRFCFGSSVEFDTVHGGVYALFKVFLCLS